MATAWQEWQACRWMGGLFVLKEHLGAACNVRCNAMQSIVGMQARKGGLGTGGGLFLAARWAGQSAHTRHWIGKGLASTWLGR